MFCKKTVKELKPYKVVPQDVWINPDGALKLDWNESTRSVSPRIKEELHKAIDQLNLNWYPNVKNDELLQAISDYVGVPSSHIIYFASSDAAQEYIARTYLESYDDVLIVAPTYDNFRVTCQSESYNINFFYLNDDFLLNLDDFIGEIKRISPKLVYISNPNNPTGTTYEPSLIEKIICTFPDVLFLLDEAYIEFSSVESCKGLTFKYDNIIITRTFSKAFGLAGFRVGFIISHATNLQYIDRIRNPKSITSLTQVATLAALKDVDYMWDYVKEVLEAKSYFVGELDKLSIRHVEGGGNFVLLNCGATKELIHYLKERNIYVRDYTQVKQLNGFDCRITIGTSAQMSYVAKIIKEFTEIEL